MTKQSKLDVIEAGIEDVVPSGINPRKYYDKKGMKELAHSIKQMGILEPLVARKRGSTYELVAGERRLRAAQMVGLRTVPVWVRDDIGDDQLLEVMFVENMQRASLLPLEEAEALDQMIKGGADIKDLADRLGNSVKWIKDRIRLLILPSSIKKLLNDEEIPIEGALECTKFGNSPVLDDIAKDLLEERSVLKDQEPMQVSEVLQTIDQTVGRMPGTVLNFDILNNSFGPEWCKHFDKKECNGCKDKIKHKTAYGTGVLCLNQECFGPKVKAAKEKAKAKKQKEMGGDDADFTRMPNVRDLALASFNTDVCKKCMDRKTGKKYGNKVVVCTWHKCYNKMNEEADEILDKKEDGLSKAMKGQIDHVLGTWASYVGEISSTVLRLMLLSTSTTWNIEDQLKSMRPKGSKEDPALAVSKLPRSEIVDNLISQLKSQIIEDWIEDSDNRMVMMKLVPELLEGTEYKVSDFDAPKCEPLPRKEPKKEEKPAKDKK